MKFGCDYTRPGNLGFMEVILSDNKWNQVTTRLHKSFTVIPNSCNNSSTSCIAVVNQSNQTWIDNKRVILLVCRLLRAGWVQCIDAYTSIMQSTDTIDSLVIHYSVLATSETSVYFTNYKNVHSAIGSSEDLCDNIPIFIFGLTQSFTWIFSNFNWYLTKNNNGFFAHWKFRFRKGICVRSVQFLT